MSDKGSAMRLFRLLAIFFATLVAGPAAAQDTPATLAPTIESDPSFWDDLSEMYLSDRALATCTYGAVVGMGAALLTSFIDLGVTFGLQLMVGGGIIGCSAWLGEVGSERFRGDWDRKHPAPDPGDEPFRAEIGGPAIADARPAQP